MTNGRLRIPDKDIRELVELAERQGWTREEIKSGFRMLAPNSLKSVSVHMTHSDHRSIANLRSQFRRAGLDLGDRREEVPVTAEEQDHIPAEDLEGGPASPEEEPETSHPNRHPTEHFVKEALRAHVDKTVTSQIVIAWVRRTHGPTLHKSSVSGVLGRICKGDTPADVKLVRISLGVYQVSLASGAGLTAAPPPPRQASASHAIAPGDLIEVVHVAMDGNIYGTDQAGNLYRITRVV